jgi:hypothetical protein
MELEETEARITVKASGNLTGRLPTGIIDILVCGITSNMNIFSSFS